MRNVELKKIKILYIVPNLKKSSGVLTVIMNYCRNIDKNRFEIDFLIMDKFNNFYEKELLNLGCNITYLKERFKVGINYQLKKEIKIFFIDNRYDIVELHAPTFSFLFMKIAKKCDIPIRIVHAHSTIRSPKKIKNLISTLLNVHMKKYANNFFACSIKSGNYWFGKGKFNNEYQVITNAIETNKFIFNEKNRLELRKNFEFQETDIVIGFVGRISKEKNLSFLVEIFKNILNKNLHYKLLIIGDGNELQNIKRKCKNMDDNLIFLGNREDVSILLNCMDIFVLPSKKEGLPMSVIEAQLMDLPCFVSDTVTTEVDIGNVCFLPLKKNVWIEAILNFKKEKNSINREKFNINCAVNVLEKLYEKYFREAKDDI